MPAQNASPNAERNISDFATLTPGAISLPLSRPRRSRRYGAMGWCATTLRHDADWRQILEPALGLHKPADLGRHCSRVQIVHNEDHHRVAAFELMQLCQ